MSSINRRAGQAAVVMLGLVTLSGATGIWATWQQGRAIAAQSRVTALMRNHMNADMMHDSIRADALAALQSADPRSGLHHADIAKDLDGDIKSLRDAIETDIAYDGSAEVDRVTDALRAPLDRYTDAAKKIVTLAGTDQGAAEQGLPAFMTEFHSLEQSMSAASDVIEKHTNEVAASAERMGTIAMVVLVIALLAAIGVTGALAVGVRRVLVAPLLALAGVMREIGAGNLKVAIPSTDRADELGDMAKAMEAFRAQLEAAEAAKAAQTKLIVDSIGTGLDSLAEGDLTARINAELTGPFAGLKSAFNGAMQSLSALIGTVTASAANIRTGSAEIAQASEDLARRTESNAASLEETSASITVLDQRLRAVAEAANRTVGSADEAIGVVGDGRSRAHDATTAMQRVSESAKGIDDVIEGLDKIAFQTRVLAMNAAVEAGRAGEAGRGFAVVADLVSALAMRAEEEAKRAREQLTVTQAEVGTAASMVGEVDEALVRIAGAVETVHGLLGEMANENRVQAAAVSEINTAVASMDRATQQNAAMVEETSAAARNLMHEVESLSEQAAQFTTEGNPGGAAHRPAAAAPVLTVH